MTSDHVRYLTRCIHIAKRGGKFVGANPQVGAVLVYDNRIIGEGYHRAYGSAHAEVNALKNVAETDQHLISKSILYVSLEPCNHHGKTGPCTKLIIDNQIPHVVIACRDPNSKVQSNGLEKLRSSGIKVEIVELEEANQLIRPFVNASLHNMPYVILKFAQSRDNFMGQKEKQIWISNHFTQHLVHKWRSDIDGIMVGTNTVITDNPQLTNRLHPGESPVRIILDRNKRINEEYLVSSDENETWFYNKEIGLQELLVDLYNRGIHRLMVEGGATLLKSFVNANLWHEARVITANKMLNTGIKSPMIKGNLASSINLGNDLIQVVYAA